MVTEPTGGMYLEHIGETEDLNDKVELYFESRKKYLEIYGSDLSKPDEDLKVTVVVPTFAELQSDNFWRLLRSLMYQRGVRQTEYDVILVINNSNKLAVQSSGAVSKGDEFEGNNGELRKRRFVENQNEIMIVRTIQHAQDLMFDGETKDSVSMWMETELFRNNIDVTDYELGLMIRFVESKIKLQCIDASSKGRGFDLEDTVSPISYARDVGSFFAHQRFERDLGKSGMIDFLDGDCFLDPNYIKSMIEMYEAGKMVVAKPLKKLIYEVPHQIEETTDGRYVKIRSALKYLLTSLSSGFDYYTSIVSNFNQGVWKVSSQLGGPQIAVRSDCLPEVGGYPVVKHNGDWQFSYDVIEKYQGNVVATMQGSCVMMSDRGRDVSIDGKRRGSLSGYNDGKFGPDPLTQDLSRRKIRELANHNTILEKEIYEIESLGWEKSNVLLDEFHEIKRSCYIREAERRRLRIKKVQSLLGVVQGMDFQEMSIEQLLNKSYVDGKIKASDLDYFKVNQSLVELSVEVLKMSSENMSDELDILALSMLWLEEMLPEYFAEPLGNLPDIKKANVNSNLGEYMYLEEAVYLMKAKLRDRFMNKVSLNS